MFTRIKPAIVAALGALVVVASSVAGVVVFAPQQDIAGDIFPERTGNQLQLPHGTGAIRTVEMWDDKRTPRFGIEDHADGTSTHYRYRADGTLASATRYAAADETGNRAIIRDSAMKEDGFTYVKDIAYFADGSVEKDFSLSDDGTTLRRFYHSNGVLAKEQVMELEWRTWKVMSELAFYDNGNKARVFLITRGKSLVDTIYGADEKVQAFKKHDYLTRTYNEVWYFEDGKTEQRLVEQTSEGTTATVKREDGSIAETYSWWGEVKDSGITVSVMDDASRMWLKQTYWWDKGALRLRSVEVFDPAGKLTNFVMFYTSGSEAGSVEATVEFHGTDGWKDLHTRREYRKDGTLSVEKRQQNTGTTISETKYTPEENLRAEVNPEWVAVRSLPNPPQMIGYVSPRE